MAGILRSIARQCYTANGKATYQRREALQALKDMKNPLGR